MRKLGLLLALLALGMFGLAHRVYGASGVKVVYEYGNALCSALDTIFVIDQSSSMEWNDPLRNRFNVVQVAMEWLVTDRWGRCPNIVHRIAVVSFGDRAYVDLPLTPLQPTSDEEWVKLKQELSQKFGPRLLGGTNHLAGLQKAKELLEQAPYLQGPYMRKQVVILITDGSPCVARLGCKYKEGMSPEAEAQYMRDLQQWVQENFYFNKTLLEREQALNALFEENPSPSPKEVNAILAQYSVPRSEEEKSIYLWVLALHNEQYDYLRTTGPYFEEIATTHGGALLHLQYNRQDIPREVDRVLSRMLGLRPQRLQCGKFVVPPYLEALTVNIYKNAGELKVRIKNGPYVLEGAQAVGERAGVLSHFAYQVAYRESGPQNEHYVFILPRPGQWEISSGYCEGIEVSVVPIQAQVMLTQEDHSLIFPLFHTQGPQRFDPQHPHYITFRLYPNSEQIRASLAGKTPPPIENISECLLPFEATKHPCALHLEATITDPKGYSETYSVEFMPNEGAWRIVQPVPVDQEGMYQVEIYGYTDCWWSTYFYARQLATGLCENGRYEVVPKGAVRFSYRVASTQLFIIKVVTPIPDQRVPAHLPLSQGLKPAPLSIRVQLVTVPEGQILDVRQVFPEHTDHAIKAQVRIGQQSRTVWLKPSEDGKSFVGKIEHWDAVGQEAQLVVTLEQEPDYHHFQAQNRQVVVEFQRLDTLSTSPWTYRCLAGLLAVVFVGVIGYQIWLRTNPLTGYLVFETEEGQVKVPVGGRRRVTKTGGPLTQLGLKKLVAERSGSRMRFYLIPKQGQPMQGIVHPNAMSMVGPYRVRWEGGSPMASMGFRFLRRRVMKRPAQWRR